MITFIKYLIDPFNIFWLLLFVAFLVCLFKKKRLFSYLAVVSTIWFLLISTPWLPTGVLNSLENRYEPVTINMIPDSTATYHIIILGGGHGYDKNLPANSLLSQNALGRLNEGIRLLRRLPNSKLVLSGSTSSPGQTTQAQMLQKTAMVLGVDKNAIILQNEPISTFREAEVYAKNYGNSFPVMLVTSASHMSRALQTFRHFGIKAIP